MNRYNHCDKKKRTRTPYRPLFEAPETTVFQERQNKAQLQYSRVAEGKNCKAPTIASTSILGPECLRFGPGKYTLRKRHVSPKSATILQRPGDKEYP